MTISSIAIVGSTYAGRALLLRAAELNIDTRVCARPGSFMSQQNADATPEPSFWLETSDAPDGERLARLLAIEKLASPGAIVAALAPDVSWIASRLRRPAQFVGIAARPDGYEVIETTYAAPGVTWSVRWLARLLTIGRYSWSA